MKASVLQRRNGAKTRRKVLKVLAAIVVFVPLILPLIMHPPKYPEVRRVNEQKQIGLYFRIGEGSNGDNYPTVVSQTNGGGFNAGSNVFHTFQVVSN
jgi:hypothetical protein